MLLNVSRLFKATCKMTDRLPGSVVFSLVLFIAAVLAQGCGHTGSVMDWRRLNKQRSEVKNRMEKLAEEKQQLLHEVEYFQKRANVLENEKKARLQELEQLRAGVRSFTETVRRSFEAAQPDVKAYFGGELCDREFVDKEQNILLIDRGNPVATRTVFTGARAYVRGPGTYVFYILRLVGDTNRVKAVAASQVLHADEPGLKEWIFFEPIASEPGDLIGFYGLNPLNLPFDQVGTGDVVVIATSRPSVNNSTYDISKPKQKDARAYSFGGSGYIRLID